MNSVFQKFCLDTKKTKSEIFRLVHFQIPIMQKCHHAPESGSKNFNLAAS